MSLIEFLRDIGSHFTIPYMLAKDSVQPRLERGLSFTEFSYMTLQAADFAHALPRRTGVEMQMGGADQWGNITAGLELIRRTSGEGEQSPRTASRTSCSCRRRAPSSASPRPASPSGWTRPERRRTRSTSTGSTSTTVTFPTYLRWFTTVVARRDRGARGDGRRPAGRARGPATPGLRRDGARPRARRGAGGRGRIRGAVPARAGDRSGAPRPDPRGHQPALPSGADAVAGGVAVLLAETGLSSSRGEARRLITGGGVTVNGCA